MASSDSGVACESDLQTQKEEPEPHELATIEEINRIPMPFKIWADGRRETSTTGGETAKNVPEQPGALPGLALFIGDIDDAWDVENLKRLNIKAVVTLCPERISRWPYWDLPGMLACAGIEQLLLNAYDAYDFNIIPVAERAFGFIDSALKHGGVLVHCYGGVNRSGAVCAAYLAYALSVPLCRAISELRMARGTVLTNQSFVQQLVHHYARQERQCLNPEQNGAASAATDVELLQGEHRSQARSNRRKRRSSRP